MSVGIFSFDLLVTHTAKINLRTNYQVLDSKMYLSSVEIIVTLPKYVFIFQPASSRVDRTTFQDE